MSWPGNPYVILLGIGALVSVLLAFHVRRNNAPTAVPFAMFNLGVALWLAAFALEGFSTEALQGKILWANVLYLGVVVVPGSWLVFALQFSGRGSLVTRRLLVLLWAEPLLTTVLTWTNPWHELFRKGVHVAASGGLAWARGPAFWLHTAYSYALLCAGAVIVAERIRKGPSLMRGQARPLLIGLLAPWVANAAYLAGLRPLGHLDLSPIGFLVCSLAITWAFFRTRLLDLLPVAREVVVEGMAEGVAVVDGDGRVVDLNPSAGRLLGCNGVGVLGRRLEDLVPGLTGALAQGSHLTLGEPPAQRWLECRASPLPAAAGSPGARLIVLRDVTERMGAEERIRAQQEQLLGLVAVGRAIMAQPGLAGTLRDALDVASTLTGAEGASLVLFRESGDFTEMIATHSGLSPERPHPEIVRVVNDGLAGWVARNRQPALLADVTRDPRWLALPPPLQPIQSALSVPIFDGQVLLAVLTLIHTQRGHFQQAHLDFVVAAVPTLAIAIRNAQLFDARERLARQQSLLYETLTSVARSFEPERVAETAAVTIARQTAWKDVVVLLPGTNGCWATYRPPGDPAMDPSPIGAGIVGRAFRLARTENVPDVASDPDSVAGASTVRSEVAVPLRYAGETLGILRVASETLAAFAAEDVRLIESLGEAVSLALGNARIHGRYLRLFEDLPIGAYQTTPDGRIVAVNRALLELLGYRSFEELATLDLEGPGFSPQYDRREFRRRIEQEGRVVGLEARWRRKDGTYVHLRENARSVLDPGGSTAGYEGTVEDITERIRAQQLREDLTHTMVHDLRSPLTMISGSLELLKVSTRPLDPAQEELVTLAGRASARLLDLVTAILDVHKLEEGGLPIAHQAVDVAAQIVEAIELARPLARAQGIRLATDVDGALPRGWADPAILVRVLQNLLGNAIKFTPRGGNVTVAARWPDLGGLIEVRVRDTGPGIPDTLRGRLFNKFVTGQQPGHGTGLGLAFCRLAIEAHGGRIWSEGEPHSGATLAFTLPVAPGAFSR